MDGSQVQKIGKMLCAGYSSVMYFAEGPRTENTFMWEPATVALEAEDAASCVAPASRTRLVELQSQDQQRLVVHREGVQSRINAEL